MLETEFEMLIKILHIAFVNFIIRQLIFGIFWNMRERAEVAQNVSREWFIELKLLKNVSCCSASR